MSSKKRFLNLSYLSNTVRIKLLANWKKLTRGVYPYMYFKDRVEDTWDGKYNLIFNESYHSLTYFDYEEAKVFHQNNKSITVDLILALAYHNSRASLESNVELAGMGDDIYNYAIDEGDRLSFIIDEEYPRFALKGEYLSAIVQGKAASVFLRCYQRSNDDKWLNLARKSLNHFEEKVDNNGIKRTLPNQMEWMEEYPSPTHSMVLNGYLFWLIGLGEYCAISKDPAYILKFENQLRSAVNWLPSYKLNKGLLYSMYRWNHCNIHYMGIMKYQFEHLYQLTQVAIFRSYAEHCEQYTNWNTFAKLIGYK